MSQLQKLLFSMTHTTQQVAISRSNDNVYKRTYTTKYSCALFLYPPMRDAVGRLNTRYSRLKGL